MASPTNINISIVSQKTEVFNKHVKLFKHCDLQIGPRKVSDTFSKPVFTENVREAGNKDFPSSLELMRNIHTQSVKRSTPTGR